LLEIDDRPVALDPLIMIIGKTVGRGVGQGDQPVSGSRGPETVMQMPGFWVQKTRRLRPHSRPTAHGRKPKVTDPFRLRQSQADR